MMKTFNFFSIFFIIYYYILCVCVLYEKMNKNLFFSSSIFYFLNVLYI